MIEFVLFFIIFILIIFVISSIVIFSEIPNKIKKQYGEPNNYFITSIIYSPFKNSSCIGTRPSALNLTYIFIYDNFLVVKNNKSEWIINKDTFIEYTPPAFFKQCSIKIKEDNIYKSECLEFSHMPKQKLLILEKFLKDNKFI